MNCPFTLAALGYKADPANPMRFVHPAGALSHYYPIVFTDDRSKTSGDCIEAIARAAYFMGMFNAGYEMRKAGGVSITFPDTSETWDFKKREKHPLLTPKEEARVHAFDLQGSKEPLEVQYCATANAAKHAHAQLTYGSKPGCNNELRAEGKPYPRTCGVCALGPCARDHMPAKEGQ